ncbi:glutamyl-tRNA reductase [Spongiivirga sp. MCCC 1A20706]|uniref:glutamyl-tRNA reductase n=1 Tax=Spongiivirga sp. MCCC 1A20706 TaxID=3160963 RepID=UPI0039775C5D
MQITHSKQSSFYAIGLNYKKADADVRGYFSLNEEGINKLLLLAKEAEVESLVVVSTCNRTELYGFAQHPFQLIKLLCEVTTGTVEEFEKVAFVLKNKEAVSHLFHVGTGLDSQILGDFEIIGQLKKSFRLSKEHYLTNAYFERLFNSVIQASKRIKTETKISSGATSVSFASVQYILSMVPNVSDKNILLFGTGKIGRNTCENLVKHTKNEHITLINRTRSLAEQVAGKFNLIVKDFESLGDEIRSSDILVVATGAQQPTVYKEMINPDKNLLILDLSVPKNVDAKVTELPNVKLVHLDDLSQITNQTLNNRRAEIPLAKEIIAEIEQEFNEWLETRKFAPTIKALRNKLQELKTTELRTQKKKVKDFNAEHADAFGDKLIQKITNHFASHLKDDAFETDDSIEIIKQVFNLDKAN